MMGIEVRIDGKSVSKSSFPICKTTNAADDHNKQKILAFTFRGGRKFQGEYQTSRDEQVEGNVWQAGADVEDLLLGISFLSRKQHQILLNTIQIARPDRRSVEKLDPAFSLRRILFRLSRGTAVDKSITLIDPQNRRTDRAS